MKSQLPRILFITAGILLLGLFLFPLWKVTLIAPQYPHGVEMHIYINKIGGKEPGTLQNINILNHYIGMQEIKPDSIAELTYFPYFVIGFSLLAFITAFINRKKVYLAWITVFIAALCIAMYDFYLWEYNYGHNLADDAPMKFDDQSFQPPLFGTKNLLNFVAKSYPHIGGWMVIAATLLAMLGTWLKFRFDKLGINKSFAAVSMPVLVLCFSSCSVNPSEIVYGEDQCHACKMMITDSRFGAELVTSKGKVYKFDAIECMVPELMKNGISNYKYVMVTPYDSPGSLIDASTATYAVDSNIQSPMGGNIGGVKNKAQFPLEVSQLIDWEEVMLKYNEKGTVF